MMAFLFSSNMPILSYLLSKGRATISRGPHCRLVVGDRFLDDLVDLFDGVEIGGEPVLRQCERNPGSGVDVRVASTDAPHPEHGRGLLRVGPGTANGVTQRPRGRESHDLVDAA